MDAWLALLGLPTLPLRMPEHSRLALDIARHLEAHPAVTRVYHPGLASHAQHSLYERLYPHGCGGMLSFELHGAAEAARSFLNDLKTIAFAPASRTSRRQCRTRLRPVITDCLKRRCEP